MTWPYVALAAVLMTMGYVYAWWVYLPRFREEYGEEHGRPMLLFFLVAPFAFIVASAVGQRRRKAI